MPAYLRDSLTTPRSPVVRNWNVDLEHAADCGQMTGHSDVTRLGKGCRPFVLSGRQCRGRECTRETPSILTVWVASGLRSVSRQFQSVSKLPRALIFLRLLCRLVLSTLFG